MENGRQDSTATSDVEKLQDVIKQLELQNAKLRQRIPVGKSPKTEKHDVGKFSNSINIKKYKLKSVLAERTNGQVNEASQDDRLLDLGSDDILTKFERQIIESS